MNYNVEDLIKVLSKFPNDKKVYVSSFTPSNHSPFGTVVGINYELINGTPILYLVTKGE